jgi:hypothetical protein
VIPNRQSKPAVLLRESYRVGRTVRKRTLANLSSLPMDRIELIRRNFSISPGTACVLVWRTMATVV